jgi:hypothetical protein
VVFEIDFDFDQTNGAERSADACILSLVVFEIDVDFDQTNGAEQRSGAPTLASDLTPDP